jgi:hypothetical protein
MHVAMYGIGQCVKTKKEYACMPRVLKLSRERVTNRPPSSQASQTRVKEGGGGEAQGMYSRGKLELEAETTHHDLRTSRCWEGGSGSGDDDDEDDGDDSDGDNQNEKEANRRGKRQRRRVAL